MGCKGVFFTCLHDGPLEADHDLCFQCLDRIISIFVSNLMPPYSLNPFSDLVEKTKAQVFTCQGSNNYNNYGNTYPSNQIVLAIKKS